MMNINLFIHTSLLPICFLCAQFTVKKSQRTTDTRKQTSLTLHLFPSFSFILIPKKRIIELVLNLISSSSTHSLSRCNYSKTYPFKLFFL